MGQKRELTIEVKFTEADKECLARLVKELQKVGAEGSKGDFKDWLKATQTGARKTWHDPSRHDWSTLAAFVDHVLADSKGKKAHESLARRHLGWSRWAARRDEWAAWQADQPKGEAPTSGPWSLVARTVAHANYAETYTKLPSYLPGWARSKRQRPPRWCQEKKLAPRMIGVDCEMCETDQDTRALVGVSVVDVDGGVLLKTLVKPPGKIVDLKEDITGLKMKDFKGVKTTLADVQASLRDIVTPETILVGHGLVHDLKALKFDHLPVIDTALLFSYKNLPRSTPGLADLCKRLLSSEMRAEGTHDSVEDAKMALELAKWECANGPTGPLDPPEDKVDPRDLTKLFVHRAPRGTLEEDLRGLFSKDNGTIGVDHVGDLEAVHGKFLGPETPLDPSRTTSAYIEFKTVDACNMAFKSLRGQQGTDALGRPQKSVKMVVKSDGKDDAKGGSAKGGKPKLTNLSRMTVADLKKELEKRKLDTSGLKAALVARLEEAQANDSDDDSDSDGDDGGAEKKTVTVMVRKMAAHQGRAIGTKDKNNEPPRTGEKRKAPGSEEKKPRRNPRPSRRARLAAKGIYE